MSLRIIICHRKGIEPVDRDYQVIWLNDNGFHDCDWSIITKNLRARQAGYWIIDLKPLYHPRLASMNATFLEMTMPVGIHVTENLPTRANKTNRRRETCEMSRGKVIPADKGGLGVHPPGSQTKKNSIKVATLRDFLVAYCTDGKDTVRMICPPTILLGKAEPKSTPL